MAMAFPGLDFKCSEPYLFDFQGTVRLSQILPGHDFILCTRCLLRLKQNALGYRLCSKEGPREFTCVIGPGKRVLPEGEA